MWPDAGTELSRTEWLTQRLSELGAEQSVRVIEALAAALANQLQDSSDDRSASAAFLAEPATSFRHDTAPDHPEWVDMCRRIARRALHGSLIDPTSGATAFHRIDEEAIWARDHLPVSVVGPFLFYRA
jgi:hypothetical protein